MEWNDFTVQRIAAMEAAFDRVSLAVQMLESALDTWETVKVDIDRLTEYLESGGWREDFEADEAGLVPRDLKRGVLSEDGLYDLLADIVRASEHLKEQAE